MFGLMGTVHFSSFELSFVSNLVDNHIHHTAAAGLEFSVGEPVEWEWD